MMNFVALFLVVSSLASAGMWSPSPADNQDHKQKHGDHHHREVIVKNGHRVVVVEYDEHGHPNTKVSISPEQQGHDHQVHKDSSSISNNDVSSPAGVSRSLDNAMENIKEASSSVLPNFGEGHNPKELICEACGKCKETVANVIETKKEIMKETAHAAKEAAVKVGDVVGKAKDKAEDVYEKAKNTASDTAREVEETAKESIGKAKSAVETAKATGNTLAGDIKRNVTGKAEAAKETAEQAAEKVKAGAEELKSGTQKRFHQLGHRAKEIWNHAFGSSGVVDGLMSAVQLFGLANAYGMSMWITFVSSHLLSENLAPQQFGMVQSKIYKVYFRAMAYSVGTALLGQLWRQRNNIFSGNAAHVLQNYNLMAGLLGILVNMLFLEPRSTKVMLERMKMDKEEGRGRGGQVGARITREAGQEPARTEAEPSTITPPQVPERREQEGVQSGVARHDEMRHRLKNLNMYSSFLNIMSLMGLSWHLVYLALRLHGSCC